MEMSQSGGKTSSGYAVASLILTSIGLLDALYLTYQHYANTIPPCHLSLFADCGQVLQSVYATVYGIPIALLGAIHYSLLFLSLFVALYSGKILWKRIIFILTAIGFVTSLYLVSLQGFVLHAWCVYCLFSALTSFVLYFLVRYTFWHEYRIFFLIKVEILYKSVIRNIFFLIDPEWVHEQAMVFGYWFGKVAPIRTVIDLYFRYSHSSLEQKVAGVDFANPIGLAAGYDYTASFPQILPAIGFGFETVGTITNRNCEGNERPRLGRLKKSRSLLVNKGFRNPGARAIIHRLSGQNFSFPLGVSIGVTNTSSIKTQKQAIDDIVSAFKMFEKSKVKNAYYELNISCPNLQTSVSFYPAKNLISLLNALKKLNIKKPVFIKMPIEKSDAEVKNMLDVIMKYPITGVIFGNLQKNRQDKALVQEEVEKWTRGYFSGKPTQKRSDELIKLAYKHAGKKLIIIGCGGVFSAKDAYRKIRNGATLVQFITGMIFEGPQIIARINRDLVLLLQYDGYSSISEAIGVDVKK